METIRAKLSWYPLKVSIIFQVSFMYSFTSGLIQFLSFQGEDVGSENTKQLRRKAIHNLDVTISLCLI